MKGIESSFLCLELYVGKNEMEEKERSFLYFLSKSQIFMSPIKILKRMKWGLMIYLLKLPKYPYIFSNLFKTGV